MANAVNIVLADALATPVLHTFLPMGKDANGVFWFEDQSHANSLGFWRISYEIKKPVPGGPAAASSIDRVARVKIALHEPVLETIGTADNGLPALPTIAFLPRVTTDYILPERCSMQHKKDLRKMNYNLQNEAQLIAMVESGIPVY